MSKVSEQAKEALKIVKNHMWWAMGAGLIPVPFVDLAAVSGVQVRMLAQIAKVYDVEFKEGRGKAVIGALVGSVVPSSMSFGLLGCVLKAIPVVGTLIGAPSMALFCGGTSWALGKVMIQHFEAGGTFQTLNLETVKDDFKKLFEEGKTLAAKMNTEKAVEPEVEILAGPHGA